MLYQDICRFMMMKTKTFVMIVKKDFQQNITTRFTLEQSIAKTNRKTYVIFVRNRSPQSQIWHGTKKPNTWKQIDLNIANVKKCLREKTI